jgi:general secretion pathway protein B
MSFILDALKKSEAQRQRADAPALYEMKMAPPRQGVPAWLLVLGGLLIINIGVLSVVLLRGNHSAAPQADANSSGTGASATPAPAAAMTPAPAAASAPAASAAAIPPDGSAAANSAASAADRADDAPAVEPAPGPAAANGANSGDVPTYDQAASAPGANLPELKLDLHAYATNPADRFVFLNMTKLKEGQSSPAGVRVEAITPDGAILSWQGSRFFLQRQ